MSSTNLRYITRIVVAHLSFAVKPFLIWWNVILLVFLLDFPCECVSDLLLLAAFYFKCHDHATL